MSHLWRRLLVIGSVRCCIAGADVVSCAGGEGVIPSLISSASALAAVSAPDPVAAGGAQRTPVERQDPTWRPARFWRTRSCALRAAEDADEAAHRVRLSWLLRCTSKRKIGEAMYRTAFLRGNAISLPNIVGTSVAVGIK